MLQVQSTQIFFLLVVRPNLLLDGLPDSLIASPSPRQPHTHTHNYTNQCAYTQSIHPPPQLCMMVDERSCSCMSRMPSVHSPHLPRWAHPHCSTTPLLHHPTWDVKLCDREDGQVRAIAKLHVCLECIHPHEHSHFKCIRWGSGIPTPNLHPRT